MLTEERRWVRRTHHRLVAGVAGGLADNTGTRAIWWRLAFVVMTLAGGLGVLIYVLLWWLVPRDDLPRSAGQRFAAYFPDAPAWFGIGLLMFGAVLLAGQLGLWTPNVGWAFLLIGLGVVLYRREAERRGVEGEAAAPMPAAATAPPPWIAEEGESPVPWEGFPAAPPPPAPRPPRPKRERSPLGWLAFGLALAATGVMWMLRDSGAVRPTLAQLLALPLVVLGAGLLIGAFIGRARWTILPGMLLIPPVLLASIITVPLTGTWDDRYLTPHTAGGLRSTYEQSGGTLSFDLTHLREGEHPGPIHATLAVGEIRVLLPKGMPLIITTRVGLGSLNGLGGSRSGLGLADRFSVAGPSPLVMDLEVGLGNVSVVSVDVRNR